MHTHAHTHTHTHTHRFGSLVRSAMNGIIFNNELDDFGVPGRNNSFNYPPSVPNYIEPNKRPLSSTVPTIMERDGSVVLAVGAAGGSRIPTATAQVRENTTTCIGLLWLVG